MLKSLSVLIFGCVDTLYSSVSVSYHFILEDLS